MAEQNTPPGGRPGRPFIPPFRGPSSADGASAPVQRSPATPERAQPRPFLPPSISRPASPAAPLAPLPPAGPMELAASEAATAEAADSPSAPGAPAMPTTTPTPPRPKSPVQAAAILAPDPTPDGRDLAHELADELAEELAVEHAISETLGQGTSSSDTASLELERASVESPDALPGLPGLPELGEAPEPPRAAQMAETPEWPGQTDDGSRSGGPDLAFLAAPEGEEAPSEPLPWLTESDAVASIEEALAVAGESPSAEAADDGADEVPSSSEPLPWLAAPAESPEPEPEPAAPTFDEVRAPSQATAATYEADQMSRITPARNLSEAAMAADVDNSTIVGANESVAEALDRVARRVRSGELRVPAVDESAGEAGALAAALAVLLGVRS